MLGYFPDVGLIKLLQLITASTLHLHVFVNNITPSDSTTLGGLTEASWTGYTVQSLVSGSWVSMGVSGHIGTYVYPTVLFSNTGGSPVTAYGWYITDSADAILIAVGLFDAAPITIAASTGTYPFIPTIGDRSEN